MGLTAIFTCLLFAGFYTEVAAYGRRVQNPSFGYSNFPNFKFDPNAQPFVPGAGPPPPPQPPPPPPQPPYTGQVGKPYCESLQYLESDDACVIPNSMHPVKGSCTKHIRCFRFRSGRLRPLVLKCAVGEIFSPVANQCEDAQLQTTFKEDDCPQVYCDFTVPKAPKQDESSFGFPIVPEKPSSDLPPCPGPDEELEFGPVQKCKPRTNVPVTNYGGAPYRPPTRPPLPPPPRDGYEQGQGYHNLRPLTQAPTTKSQWPVDDKYIEQSDQQNPYLKPPIDRQHGKGPKYETQGIVPNQGEYNPNHKGAPPGYKEKDREPIEPPFDEDKQVTDPFYDDEPPREREPEHGASTDRFGHRKRGRNGASSLKMGVNQFVVFFIMFFSSIFCYV